MGKYQLLAVLGFGLVCAGVAMGDEHSATPLRTRTVQLEVGPLQNFDPAATCGRSVAFKLFDEARVVGQLEEVDLFGIDGLTARGVLHGADEGGSFSLTLEGKTLSAVITTPVLGNYEVATLDDGTYELRELGVPTLATSSVVGEVRQAADQDGNFEVSLQELLRVVQFYNAGGLHCADPSESSEDGYSVGPGADWSCAPHESDYAPQDWQISLTELLRTVQIHNLGGYAYCPDANTEDGFCPGAAAG